ncbi:MAG: hypothetical protein Q4P17_07670 [Methanobacterium sp.]|nr:hypothetical protein [Methanobacterium sp.]
MDRLQKYYTYAKNGHYRDLVVNHSRKWYYGGWDTGAQDVAEHQHVKTHREMDGLEKHYSAKKYKKLDKTEFLKRLEKIRKQKNKSKKR